MASSSRSLARRWGFWGLHPIPRSRYQTRPGWYCTSNSRWITWATRRRVHKSVGNPAALAPRRRISARRCFWSAVRRGGRPGWGLARSASTPCSWSTFFPTRNRGRGDADQTTHFPDSSACLEHPNGDHPAHFQSFCTPFGPHPTILPTCDRWDIFYTKDVTMARRRSIEGDAITWLWIGHHDDYERFLSGRR
jgi:hypothetical protein